MEHILSGGPIPVYYYTNKHLHSFCIGLYIHAGPLYETDDESGITHLWEHVIFRKLQKIYGGLFYHTLDRLGLSFYAATYKEFVSIRIMGAPQHFAEAAEIMAKIFEPIGISATELEAEKKRIRSEIREEDEKTSLDYFTQQIIWKGTPLQKTILGQSRVLNRIGVRALQAFQNQILSEGNLFFYVTGRVKEVDLSTLLDGLRHCHLTPNTNQRKNIAPLPEAFFKRNSLIAVKNNSYHYIRFSLDFDVSRYTSAELDMLYAILFSGETCKLHQELSENSGLIYSYDAVMERYSNIGNLYFSFEVQKKHILTAIDKTIDILCGLKKGIRDELDFAKPLYVDNADFLLDDSDELNWVMAYDSHMIDSGYLSIEDRKRAHKAVTAARLTQMAQEIFQPDNLVVTLKTSKKELSVDEVSKRLTRLADDHKGE